MLKQLFRKKSQAHILSEAEKLGPEHTLRKHLGVRDLTSFGIAAIIGAGIFSTIGKASYMGGPGVVFLFIFTAIACSFAAFAYAEFASIVPVSGSAYTYSYLTFGELFAWIIGWALIMEYAIGNIVVAISWSDYFTSLVNSIDGLHIPEWMTMDYFSASSAYEEISKALASGMTMTDIEKSEELSTMVNGYMAWNGAPLLGNFHLVLDIPALAIIALITWLVYRGMKESRNASNILVIIKLSVVLLVIVVGAFYVNTDNWDPFMPNGFAGLIGGISSVFFAYIGFDAISTTAEECHNPQRDMPRSIMYSIILCTVLYVVIALVITGMVSYKELNVGDPLAYVFDKIQEIKWLSGVIAVSAVVAIASVLLVYQLGQPRIWMTMSRDGLLPPAFKKIHPKFKTPGFATIITGLMVGIPTLFLDLSFVIDVCSLGTLFAFVLVCGGVLRLEADPDAPRGKFKVPYFNSRYVLPIFAILFAWGSYSISPDGTKEFFASQTVLESDSLVKVANAEEKEVLKTHLLAVAHRTPESFDSVMISGYNSDPGSVSADNFIAAANENEYKKAVRMANIRDEVKYRSGVGIFMENIPMWMFIILFLYLVYRAVTHKLSLIPVLGLLSCFYMMSQLGWKNWLWFCGWLVIGLVIYFTYSMRHSKLNKLHG